ncbi:MAG: hypothetical protein KAT05_01805 [Spirochaetes bacterium]|nr:hypothetical protein [Spirochaetota bacterium]
MKNAIFIFGKVFPNNILQIIDQKITTNTIFEKKLCRLNDEENLTMESKKKEFTP